MERITGMSNKKAKDTVIVGTVIKVTPKDLTLGACLLNYLNSKRKQIEKNTRQIDLII